MANIINPDQMAPLKPSDQILLYLPLGIAFTQVIRFLKQAFKCFYDCDKEISCSNV